MTQTKASRKSLSPVEMARLFDALSKEGKDILGTQMITLNYLTTRLQQLHIELLERVDRGETIMPADFGGLCVSFSDEKTEETWSQGIGASEPVCNAFLGTFHAAWTELPEKVFDTIVETAKETKDVREKKEEEEKKEKKEESPVVDLEKWKVDNQWKN